MGPLPLSQEQLSLPAAQGAATRAFAASASSDTESRVVETGGLPIAAPRPTAKTRAVIRAAKLGTVTNATPEDP